MKQILDEAIIKDTVSRTSGYAHIKYKCELKDIPEVHKIHEVNNQAIAVHLDNYRGNFGGRQYSLHKTPHGTLKYTGTIYTD